MTHPKTPFSKRPHLNLVQSIRLALNEDEIEGLMVLAASIEHASDKTRSRWHEAAKQRRKEIRR